MEGEGKGREGKGRGGLLLLHTHRINQMRLHLDRADRIKSFDKSHHLAAARCQIDGIHLGEFDARLIGKLFAQLLGNLDEHAVCHIEIAKIQGIVVDRCVRIILLIAVDLHVA